MLLSRRTAKPMGTIRPARAVTAKRTLRIGIGRFTSAAGIDYAAATLIAAHAGAGVGVGIMAS